MIKGKMMAEKFIIDDSRDEVWWKRLLGYFASLGIVVNFRVFLPLF